VLRGSKSNLLCYVAVRAACYMLRGSKISVLYVTWQYVQRVMCYVAVRAACYVTWQQEQHIIYYVTLRAACYTRILVTVRTACHILRDSKGSELNVT
jgi:hypothetical protein